MSEPDRTALFKSEPSAVPPFSLSSSFFGSEVYVDAARNDIDKLLDLFVDQWRELAGETVEREDQVDGGAAVEGAGDGKRKPIKRALFRKSRGTKSGPSIYAVFKTSWVHLGWDKVHISVVSAPLRQEWFRIFSRFFIGAFAPFLSDRKSASSHCPQNGCETITRMMSGKLAPSLLSIPFGRRSQRRRILSSFASTLVRHLACSFALGVPTKSLRHPRHAQRPARSAHRHHRRSVKRGSGRRKLDAQSIRRSLHGAPPHAP